MNEEGEIELTWPRVFMDKDEVIKELGLPQKNDSIKDLNEIVIEIKTMFAFEKKLSLMQSQLDDLQAIYEKTYNQVQYLIRLQKKETK